MVERVIQLKTAARHPWVVASGNDKRGVVRQLAARLVDPFSGGGNDAGEDQRLGPRPAFGEALVDQELIGSPLRHVTC